MEVIAEEAGPEAAGLVASLMERNAVEAAWAEEQSRKGLERERDEWRERAFEAEARLERIEQRLAKLLD